MSTPHPASLFRTTTLLCAGLWLRRSQNQVLVSLLALITLTFSALPASAKTEYREVAWKWCIWDCSYSGDYTTPAETIDAWNAGVDAAFGQCVSKMRPCSSCSKINQYNATDAAGGFAVLNDQPTFLQTTVSTATTTSAACQTTPGQTFVTSSTGRVAAWGSPMCPQEDGWTQVNGPLSTVTLNGRPTTKYRTWCQREVVDPPVACNKPQLGDPLSPIDQTQNETATDYTTPDGLLQVRRSYTSAAGGKWTWGELDMRLTDPSGRRTGPLPTSALPFVGTVMQTPPGYYPNMLKPPRIAVTRTFNLLPTQPATGLAEIWVDGPEGARTVFTATPAGQFASKAVGGLQLSHQLVLTDHDGVYAFDGRGRLQRHTYANGQALSYDHDDAGTRVTATPGGRSIFYAKDATTGRITSATLPDGSQIKYAVDKNSAIQQVTYADATAKTYLYNEPSHLSKPVPNAMLLTGFTDENRTRQGTFTYDGVNATSTQRAGGVDRYAVSYAGSGITRITSPLGASGYHYEWSLGPDGERRLMGQRQPAGAGCGVSLSRLNYDPQGHIASVLDINNTLTCYSHDPSRSLEVTRVEGLAPGTTCAGANTPVTGSARKITSQWHPTWGLKTKVAEPGKVTAFIYNGQPDPFSGNAPASCAPSSALLPDGSPIAVLCRQVEQATTDPTGAQGFSATPEPTPARQHRWTYNAAGQILSARGPQGETSSFSYYSDTTATHTAGDLAQATNPAGQATQFTHYNRHGQLLQSIDANGITSQHTFDARQRPTSLTQAGLRTTYRYSPTGQLTSLLLPNATQFGFTYDAAQRLIQVTDQAGNAVSYTLDNAGNRVQEQIKDPSGALSRSLGRVFDALNRVQTATGAPR
jgi:YD repeat-containing protein